jgi:voltage-gated potassium channel
MLGGGAVLWRLGAGRWSFGESLWMAVISATTVGFGELPQMDGVPYARAVVAGIILLGLGTFAFLQSSLTAFLVESALGEAIRRKRMDRRIARLEGHVVVAGCGATGLHVVEELVASGTAVVVIDKNREHLDKANVEVAGGALLWVQGDATEDHTLVAAGIARATGLVAALTHDRDNLYVTLSARGLNPSARIVSKVVEPEAAPKMLKAGANGTVSPNVIGGRRLAAELTRPVAVEFLDVMLRDKAQELRLEELTVPPSSPHIGRRLGDLPLREVANALVVGLRGEGRQLRYNPSPDERLTADATLVVLARVDEMPRLRAWVEDGR